MSEPSLSVGSPPDGPLSLTLLPDVLAICRFGSGEPVPAWVWASRFYSITRTPDDLTVVCAAEQVPEDAAAVRGWRAFRVDASLDFTLIGILAGLTVSLARAGVSIFAISAYTTDYILVRGEDAERAAQALTDADHHVRR